MPRLALGLVVAICVGGCADGSRQDPEFLRLCGEPREDFSLPLHRDDSGDGRIRERFGSVCEPLVRLDGLDFGAERRAYLCGFTVDRREDERTRLRRLASEKAFGRPMTMESFSSHAGEPDDVRERATTGGGGRTSRGDVRQSLPLNVSAGFVGFSASAIVVSDERGEVKRIVFTERELDETLAGVHGWLGAMALMDLRGAIGSVGIAQHVMKSRGRPIRPVQCTAGHSTATAQGWRLDDLEVHRNCQPTLRRSVEVTRSGEVIVLASRTAGGPLEPVICAD